MAPDFATSATSTPCSLAIKPRKEKMTTPAKIEVHELTVQTIRASWEKNVLQKSKQRDL